MADPQSTIQKAAAARERGELWRAKEILQGRLSSGGFQPEIHGELGRVLLEMKDTMEAGRHLYACHGMNGGSPEAEAAIALFLSRHGRGSPTFLRDSLPARARTTRFENLPEGVREDFLERGFEPPELGETRGGSSKGSSGGGVTVVPLALIALVLFLLLIGLGFLKALEIVSDWLT